MEVPIDTNPKPFGIKIYSCILAIAYLLFGAAVFHELPQFQETFAGFNIPLPFLTRTTLYVGAYGWLCLAVEIAILIVVKDLRFHSRLMNPLFTLAFLFWTGFIAYALVWPLLGMVAHGGIH